MTPAADAGDRRLIASMGGLARSAKYDGKAMTAAAAKAANVDRFERQADPENLLPTAERARRATALRRAHMKRLALRSAQARRRKASR